MNLRELRIKIKSMEDRMAELQEEKENLQRDFSIEENIKKYKFQQIENSIGYIRESLEKALDKENELELEILIYRENYLGR